MSEAATILVVDDERLIRLTVRERLSRSGFDVAVAESGEAALTMLGATQPDLMILDVQLGGIDGLTTLARARMQAPDLDVLMISAHSTVGMAVEAMKLGAGDFLVKPFELSALEAAVRRMLAARRARTEIAQAQLPALPIHSLVGEAPAIQHLRELIRRVAASDATTVLIEGESGTGKEVVARAIHDTSVRAPRPLLQVNCAALPDALLESEIFGHERGAFTNAHVQKKGIFELADGGSVLLDEVSELAPVNHAKLLSFLENRRFRRVGGAHEIQADVRVLAATNSPLEERVAAGQFRQDLFFRLNVVRLELPPLREHSDDVPILVAHFVARFNQDLGRRIAGVSADALELLVGHDWPGNVRELRNVLERAIILHPGVEEIRPEHLPEPLHRRQAGRHSSSPPGGMVAPSLDLEETERRLIVEALEQAGKNQSQAARLLHISRDTLRYRMKRHGLL